MTRCDAALSRVAQRNMADRFVANPVFLEAVGCESVEAHTEAVVARMQQVEREMLLRFPVPVLHVDTTGQYNPSIDTVVAFATAVQEP
jgi:hypothetical protein